MGFESEVIPLLQNYRTTALHFHLIGVHENSPLNLLRLMKYNFIIITSRSSRFIHMAFPQLDCGESKYVNKIPVGLFRIRIQ